MGLVINLDTVSDEQLFGACRRAEAALGALLGVEHVVATSSGLTALEVSLIAAGVCPGDVVACDALYPYSILAVANVGARGLPLDLDPTNGAPTEVALQHAERQGVRVVVLTPYAGWRSGVLDAAAIARDLGLVVIEDRAQCLGRHAEPWIASVSFQHGKLLSCGQGGAVLAHDASQEERVRRSIELGWWPRHRPAAAQGWSSGWDERGAGRSARLAPITAELLSARLGRVPELVTRASRTATELNRALKSIAPQAAAPTSIGSLVLPVVVSTASHQEPTVDGLATAGFQAGLPTHPPTTRWPGLRDHWSLVTELPGTEALLRRLCLVVGDLGDNGGS